MLQECKYYALKDVLLCERRKREGGRMEEEGKEERKKRGGRKTIMKIKGATDDQIYYNSKNV